MAITVVLLHNDSLFHATLDAGKEITFGSNKKDDVYVSDFIGNQITIKCKQSGICVQAKKAYGFEKENVPLDSVVLLDEGSQTVLYLSPISSQSDKKIKLPYNCMLKFGRSKSCDVTISFPFVSSSHFVLKTENGNVRVEDSGSVNGIYVNGRRAKIAKLKSGDILSIWSVQIQLVNGELLFYNVGENLIIHDDVNELENGPLNVQTKGGKVLYRRSPRTQDILPADDIVLAAAPTKGQKHIKGRGMLSSLAGSGAMIAASMATAAVSPALLAARAASLVSPITSIASSKSANKAGKMSVEQYEAMRQEKYGAYIADQNARIESVAKVQRDILTRENPEPKECANILFGLKRSLWERMPSDRDFLDVRIGMGYENLCVSVKSRTDSNGFQMDDDEIRELSEQIIEETRVVDNIPARLKLLTNNTVGIIGDRLKTVQLVKNLVVSLATSHCFEDVRIVGFFDEKEKDIWEPLKWLPHVWDENHQFRSLAFDKESAHDLCDVLNDELKRREGEIKDSSYRSPSIPKPYYIFILGSKDLVEKEEIMRHLVLNDPAMGVTSLFLFDDMYLLPHDCKYIVDMNNGPCAFDRNEANKKIYFTEDPYFDDVQFDMFARRMSAVELVGFAKKIGLPNGVTFLQGYGLDTVEQLNIIERWNRSVPYMSLAAPIGVMNGGKIFSLDIHEKGHGPHGLVAGTTGSGKSELLQTWILSMALTYHPHDVSFVIIDFKGGGLADFLDPLPHVVGKITNIGPNIWRALVSLDSEIKRRQAVFAKYGVKQIDKYQELYKTGRIDEPLPHLIIVVDEFAELKKEEPEFMAELISASRVGRSLGVHLVLATQKPGGVVDDQIQSNSRFRLCLKVQDVNDSREMIKRPDAAKITQAGRSYIRVGEDEYFDLFQSFWSGAPYFGNVKRDETSGNQVRIVDLSGKRIQTVGDRSARLHSDLDELTAIVRYVCSVTNENHIEALPGPWLPELPETITINELAVNGGFDGEKWAGVQKWLTVPIGKYDSPRTQSQGIQYIDFASDGHYGIYGAPGTGKTTLLKEVVLALGTYYTPEDVNIYILDCGGWSMSVFSNMPHVGGVALDSEEEKFAKFEKLITEEFERRKKVFLRHGVSSLAAYREAVSSDMPAIVIAIDNIVPVFDLYPDMENLFVTIARDGATYGIYMIYTANSTTGVRYKVLQNIKGAIAFELTDKGDYATLVGRLDGMALPRVIGRAFFKNNPPIEFQAALFSAGQTERERTVQLQNVIAKMNTAWKGNRPKPIPVMPESISINHMLAEYSVRTSIPVGIRRDDIQTAYVDLADNYSMLISGPMYSGKSRMLTSMAELVTVKFPDSKVFVFDSQNSALSGMKASAYKYALHSDDESVSSMLSELVEFLNVRKRAQNQARQDIGASFDEKAFIASYEMLCIVIDDLKEFVDAVSDANKNTMERICRLAQNLGVIVLAAGRMSDISKYNEIESLTRVIVGNQNGLAVAGTPAQLSFFQNNLKYSEKDTEPGEGNGYLFVNGSCTRIKLM